MKLILVTGLIHDANTLTEVRGHIVGTIGVSGDTPQHNEEIAQVDSAAFKLGVFSHEFNYRFTGNG